MYGKELGEMAWMDLSVPNAEKVSDFYQSVLGWTSEPVAMGSSDDTYNDFVMASPQKSNDAVDSEAEKITSPDFMTGICHAKGDNKDMPALWLPYFLVNNLDESILKVLENGGTLETKIKKVGQDCYVVIKDPAGAMAAIYQKNSE